MTEKAEFKTEKEMLAHLKSLPRTSDTTISYGTHGLEYNSKDGEFYVQLEKIVKKFDIYKRDYVTIEKQKLLPKIRAVDWLELSKTLKFTIVFVRTALNPVTLTNIQSPFKQSVTVTVKSKNGYLRMINQIPLLTVLGGSTQSISLNEMQKLSQGEQPLTDLEFGKEERITIEQAKELLKEPNTYRYILESTDSGFQQCLYFRKM
jgi:hypothetical protein